MSERRYSDDQPRDDHGRWTGGGGGDDSSGSGGGGGDVASAAVSAAKAGGGTLDPKTAQEVTKGIAVAVPDHSGIYQADQFFANDEQAAQTVRDWMDKNAEVLSQPNMNVGVWHDTANGEVVLDPSEVVSDRATAIQLGIARDQQAVYDIGAGEEIPTGGTGGRSQAQTQDRHQAEQALLPDDGGGEGRAGPRDRGEIQAIGWRPLPARRFLARRSNTAQVPPNYRPADTPGQSCHTCEYVNQVTGLCRKYNVMVDREHVCDSWSPEDPGGGMTPEDRYSDDQPRDDHGRWSGGGGDDSSSGSGGGGEEGAAAFMHDRTMAANQGNPDAVAEVPDSQIHWGQETSWFNPSTGQWEDTTGGAARAMSGGRMDTELRYWETPEYRDKYNDADRTAMAKKGHAMPDGSYPIADEEDLHNAIHAVGRGGSDHDAIRKHIIASAARLGHSDAIPGNWNADGSLKQQNNSLAKRRERRKERHRAIPLGREVRFFAPTQVEVRQATADSPEIVITGAAIMYGSPYRVVDFLGEFRETIHAGSAAGIVDNVDCRLLFNHDGMPMARTASRTMTLIDTPSALRFRASLDARQQLSNDFAIAIERGDLSQMSVGMVVNRDKWDEDGGMETRDIFGLADLPDISGVTYPCSPTTHIEVAKRMAFAMPLESRARLRNMEVELRAGKVLSADSQAKLVAALSSLHDLATAGGIDPASFGPNSTEEDDELQSHADGSEGSTSAEPDAGLSYPDGSGSRSDAEEAEQRDDTPAEEAARLADDGCPNHGEDGEELLSPEEDAEEEAATEEAVTEPRAGMTASTLRLLVEAGRRAPSA